MNDELFQVIIRVSEPKIWFLMFSSSSSSPHLEIACGLFSQLLNIPTFSLFLTDKSNTRGFCQSVNLLISINLHHLWAFLALLIRSVLYHCIRRKPCMYQSVALFLKSGGSTGFCRLCETCFHRRCQNSCLSDLSLTISASNAAWHQIRAWWYLFL